MAEIKLDVLQKTGICAGLVVAFTFIAVVVWLLGMFAWLPFSIMLDDGIGPKITGFIILCMEVAVFAVGRELAIMEGFKWSDIKKAIQTVDRLLKS